MSTEDYICFRIMSLYVDRYAITGRVHSLRALCSIVQRLVVLVCTPSPRPRMPGHECNIDKCPLSKNTCQATFAFGQTASVGGPLSLSHKHHVQMYLSLITGLWSDVAVYHCVVLVVDTKCQWVCVVHLVHVHSELVPLRIR